MGSNKNVVISFSIAILLLLSLLLLLTYNSKCSSNNKSQMNYNANSNIPMGFSNDNEKYYNFEAFTTPAANSQAANAGSGEGQVQQSSQNPRSVASNTNPNPNLAASGIGNYSPSSPDFNTAQMLDPNQTDNYDMTTQFSSVDAIGGGSGSSGADPMSQNGMQSCFPRDRLTASDLLPKDAADSKWARINPSGTGDIHDQNYLTAGYHVGINTVGQSLRNANLQLRSEIPNPQNAVGPWMISTIEPDLRQNTLEIGSSPAY
jgi:hypothetical protein